MTDWTLFESFMVFMVIVGVPSMLGCIWGLLGLGKSIVCGIVEAIKREIAFRKYFEYINHPERLNKRRRPRGWRK